MLYFPVILNILTYIASVSHCSKDSLCLSTLLPALSYGTLRCFMNEL